MRRWMPRALVILTILVVLGVGGYAGQVCWARRIAAEEHLPPDGAMAEAFPAEMIEWWRETPWYGRWGHDLEGYDYDRPRRWVPRRVTHEFFVRVTGQNLPNDPSAWEAWFEAHPSLVWDEKQKRLVEPKP